MHYARAVRSPTCPRMPVMWAAVRPEVPQRLGSDAWNAR
jgi:hypothetical protein